MEEFGIALASLEHAEGIATEVGNRSALGDIARFRARICRLCADLPEAERYAQQSISVAENAGPELLRAEALEELAQAAAHAGFSRKTAERDAARTAEMLAGWPGTEQ